MNRVEILKELYRGVFGEMPEACERLAGAGGDRVYWRMHAVNRPSAIGVEGDNAADCRAFVALSRCFRSAGVNVPEILAVSGSGMEYLQQDLGGVSLFSLLGDEENRLIYVPQALRELARMQAVPQAEWERVAEYPPFSRRQAMYDLNYFKYEFLKPMGIPFDEERLEDDFEHFAADLADDANVPQGFMYRDFQSRNVMIKEGRPWLIDFQGGRRGPVVYDAVSFLWQAKAGFSDGFRAQMLEEYAGALRSNSFPGAEMVLAGVKPFAFFRTLQVLGAYGFRGLVERRAHFIESIPGALRNLEDLLITGAADRYPELKRVCGLLATDRRFDTPSAGTLTVTVFSFSYKRGYPADYTGNGGGFMFDCRAMHNPGRYEQYKSLTGRDLPVIEFLKEKGEIDPFCERALGMVRPAVERYLKRGFTNLQIGFGCTGGQHRSVYSADYVARALAKEYPQAKVIVIHREQKIQEEF